MSVGSVYILKSQKNGRYYIGSAENVARRVSQHNEGRVKATEFIRPLKLVFQQEYSDVTLARRIEYRLKALKRRDILERIIAERKILITGL